MTTIKYSDKFSKNSFEYQAWQENRLICGIDEVGRGCLAGPVVTAAVIMHPGKIGRGIKDSKLMTSEELEKAYAWLIKNCWYSVASVSNRTIDNHNIYQATLMAMKRAIMQLMTHCPQKPSAILIDAMPLNLMDSAYREINVMYFPKGERKSTSIAAASIIAKVSRDRLMRTMHSHFPSYFFAQHKGYATKLHQNTLRQHGHSVIHRMSFLGFLTA